MNGQFDSRAPADLEAPALHDSVRPLFIPVHSENDLAVVPVLNKIDLPAAQPDKYAAEIARIIARPTSATAPSASTSACARWRTR